MRQGPFTRHQQVDSVDVRVALADGEVIHEVLLDN
jgi:hypothetical protein